MSWFCIRQTLPDLTVVLRLSLLAWKESTLEIFCLIFRRLGDLGSIVVGPLKSLNKTYGDLEIHGPNSVVGKAMVVSTSGFFWTSGFYLSAEKSWSKMGQYH